MEIMADFYGDDREEADAASLTEQEERIYSADGGEPMMSVEQLKQEMFKSLRDTGTIEAIRAQLRRRFIEKLKQHGRKQAALDGNATNDQDEREKWRVEDQLVHGLIHEYLQRHDMEHTLAVFEPEIGGAQHWLPRDAIIRMLRLPEELSPQEDKENSSQNQSTTTLLAVLLKELQRRLAVATMSSGTQTAMDCHDHRIALENQLRRVENSYLAETASHKQDLSVKSFEERVLRYQREYDELCEKRLQEDLVRFKATELALMRVEERKKFDREMETLKTTLFQEHRERLQRLQDRERELEMMFSARKTELESSLFEARQRLFQEIETLRTKQQDVDARSNSESRHLVVEAKRLQLLEEKIKVREENLQAAVDGMVAEKEQAWLLEKLRWQSEARDREERLLVREAEADKGLAAAKQAKEEMHALRVEITRLEDELLAAQGVLDGSKKTIAKLEAEKKLLHEDLAAREAALSEDKHSMKSLSYENARLAAELKTVQHEQSKLEDLVVEKSSDAKQLEAEVRDLQHQLINLKLAEANAVVEERKKLMQVLENERSDARWKENDLVGKLLELQTRLAESEASREKYQTQYEDEKVHVETLRHEVSSLHTLLAQTQSAVATRQPLAARGSSSARNGESSDSGSERMLMRMMEMMAQMQMQGFGGGGGGVHQQWSAPQSMESVQTTQHSNSVLSVRLDEEDAKKLQDMEDAKKLQAEQERRERELLDQREYERKKQEREEAERREQELRRKKFDDEMEQERLARAKREQELEDDRIRRAAEQESRFQEELEQQQKAIQEARDTQKKLLDEQIAQEQKRLQDERLREEERARVAKEEADVAARRIQRLQEEAQEEEARKEHERQRLRREAEEAAVTKERQLREQEQRDQDERVAAIKSREAAEERVVEPTYQEETIDYSYAGTERRPLEETEPTPVQLPVDTVLGFVGEASPAHADDGSDSESYHSDREPSDTSDTEASEVKGDDVLDRTDAVEVIEATPTQDEVPVDEDINSSPGTLQASESQTETVPPPKSEEELEEERRQVAEEAKKKEDEAALDVFRQRVLARRAAQKQRQQELEEQKKREEEERAAAELARADASEDELEHSGGSFASSAASSSGSF